MNDAIDKDELIFADDEVDTTLADFQYNVLIVDDEEVVHNMTSLALRDVVFNKRGINFLHAYSAAQAKDIIEKTPNIAVIFLDVIMETNSAGLDLVKVIREDLNNKAVRIILRTGQADMSPEEEVIINYDINDYKDKTELTQQKLFTSLISSLRSYNDLIRIQNSKDGLKKVLKSTSSLVKFKFINEFFSGLVQQIVSLISTCPTGTNNIDTIVGFYKDEKLVKLVGTGQYSDEQTASLALITKFSKDIKQIFNNSETIKKDKYMIFKNIDENSKSILLILEGNISALSISDELLELFINNAANIYEHLLSNDIKFYNQH